MKYLGFVISVVALAGVVVVTLVAQGTSDDPPDPGAANPSSEQIDYRSALADATGSLAKLYSRGNELVETDDPSDALDRELAALRGTPVVVNEWGSWCPPCRAEFPIFQEVSAKRGEQVAFLGVDAVEPSREIAESWLRRYPIPYPSIYDERQEIHLEVWKLRTGLPATAFYDASGKRVFVHQGPYLEPSDLEADIDRYLR